MFLKEMILGVLAGNVRSFASRSPTSVVTKTRFSHCSQRMPSIIDAFGFFVREDDRAENELEKSRERREEKRGLLGVAARVH